MNENFAGWKQRFVFHWIVNNTAGFASGAVLGEYIGHFIERQFGWQIGILVAGIIFEVIVWVMRFLTIKDTKGFGSFKPIDTIIWLSGEVFGILLAEGAYEVTHTNILVIGPIVGSALGASLLILLWLIQIPPTRKRFWAIRSILNGIIGIFALSFSLSFTFLMIQELSKIVSKALNLIWGLGVFAALTGAIIGVTTGFAYIKLKAVRSYEPDLIEGV